MKEWPSRSSRLLALGTIAALYLAIPNARPDFTRFNCQDSSSYLALADSLAHGRGYTRSLVPSIYIPHTTWPPGVPALLVPASLLGGPTVNWLAVKWTMALVGLIGVVFAWDYLRRATGRRDVADFGAILLALNPFYWDFSHQAMAEIPLTVWLIGGLLLVDRAWAGRSVSSLSAFGTGLVCGLGMMFKGHAGGLVFAPLAYLGGPRKAALSRKAALMRWLLHAAGFAVPQLAWMIRCRLVPAPGFDGINRFRSILAADPNDPASRLRGAGELIGTVLENARHHVIYRLPEMTVPFLWPEGVLSGHGMGWIALALTLLLLIAALPRRPELLAPAFAALVMALLNVPYAFGGAPRFWFPITTILTLMIAANLGPTLPSTRNIARAWFRGALLLILVVNLDFYVESHEAHPYNRSAPWSEFADLLDTVARRPDLHPKAVLTENPAAFQLGTGLPAPWGREDLTFDCLVLNSEVGRPPDGSRILMESGPWIMMALGKRMTHGEIERAVRGSTPPLNPQ